MSNISHSLRQSEYLVSSWWKCLGWFKKYGPDAGNMSPREALGFKAWYHFQITLSDLCLWPSVSSQQEKHKEYRPHRYHILSRAPPAIKQSLRVSHSVAHITQASFVYTKGLFTVMLAHWFINYILPWLFSDSLDLKCDVSEGRNLLPPFISRSSTFARPLHTRSVDTSLLHCAWMKLRLSAPTWEVPRFCAGSILYLAGLCTPLQMLISALLISLLLKCPQVPSPLRICSPGSDASGWLKTEADKEESSEPSWLPYSSILTPCA